MQLPGACRITKEFFFDFFGIADLKNRTFLVRLIRVFIFGEVIESGFL